MGSVVEDIVINNTVWHVVYTLDPLVYNMIVLFALLLTAVGAMIRNAIVNIIAFAFCIVAAVSTASPYPVGTYTFVFFAGNVAFMYLLVGLAIVNIVVFIIKILSLGHSRT